MGLIPLARSLTDGAAGCLFDLGGEIFVVPSGGGLIAVRFQDNLLVAILVKRVRGAAGAIDAVVDLVGAIVGERGDRAGRGRRIIPVATGEPYFISMKTVVGRISK